MPAAGRGVGYSPLTAAPGIGRGAATRLCSGREGMGQEGVPIYLCSFNIFLFAGAFLKSESVQPAALKLLR